MAAIGAAQGTTYNLPNFVGELFKLTPMETPFLSMIGGLNGGRSTTAKEFTWQSVDNVSYTLGGEIAGKLEGADPTLQGRSRTEYSNVCQIFQYGWEVSYTKQAATGQLGDGTAARTISAVPIIGSQPVQDELSFQQMLVVEQAAKDVEFAFLNNSFVQPNDNTTARKTRGLLTAITTNAIDVAATDGTAVNDGGGLTFDYTGGASDDLWSTTGAAAHGLKVGDEIEFSALTNGAPYATGTAYYVVSVPSSSTFKLSLTPGGAVLEGTADGSAGTAYKRPAVASSHINYLMRLMVDNGAPMRNIVLFANSFNKQALTDAYGYAPESRNVGGLNINQIETDFNLLGIVFNRNIPRDTLLVADLSVIRPVFLNIPGKGHFFSEPLAQTGAAWKYQLYGEVGLEYGPENWHGKITGLRGGSS